MEEKLGNAKVRERDAAWVGLALVCAASMVVLVILGTRLSFFGDDWNFLLVRPGLVGSSIFVPHNGQLVAGVDLTFKAVVALFGYSQLPFRLILGLAVAGVGVSVYLLVAERAGWILGLAATAVVVFLGPAWEDLLFFASVGPIIALATGLAAIYVLERDGPWRNGLACALLVVSISFSGVGLAFVIGAAVAVLLRAQPAKLWISAIPVVLYGIWSVWKGESTSDLSLANVEHLPKYIFESASIGLASITGLNHGAHRLLQGEVLLIVTLGIALFWVFRGWRPSPWVAVPISAALAFWALTGLSFVPGREAVASRYQLVDAALLLVIGAELIRTVRRRTWMIVAMVAAAALVVLSNAFSYRTGYRFLRDQSVYAEAELGALEITRGHTRAEHTPLPLNPYLVDITPTGYYEQTDRHGTIAHLSPAAISVASDGPRRYADYVLAGVYGMSPVPTGRSIMGQECRRFPAGSGPTEVELRPGSILLANLGASALTVFVGRFSGIGMEVPVGSLPSRSKSTLDVPSDAVARRWRLTVQGKSPVIVCASPS